MQLISPVTVISRVLQRSVVFLAARILLIAIGVTGLVHFARGFFYVIHLSAFGARCVFWWSFDGFERQRLSLNILRDCVRQDHLHTWKGNCAG